MINKINKFKNRELTAKELFIVKKISYKESKEFIEKHHYLKSIGFSPSYKFGLFIDNILVGCATFALPQGTNTIKGWLGSNEDNYKILELSRFCIVPELNGTNTSSFFLSYCLRVLKKEKIDLIITLADSSKHVGSLYQVCNFKYFGKTSLKKDYYSYYSDKEFKKGDRKAPTKQEGVWVNRPQKYRYAFKLNKKVDIFYNEQPIPKITEVQELTCCNGTKIVVNNKRKSKFTCPICTGKLIKL